MNNETPNENKIIDENKIPKDYDGLNKKDNKFSEAMFIIYIIFMVIYIGVMTFFIV